MVKEAKMSAISRSTISIRFFGKNLVPEQLTTMLGCYPTRSGKTGEDIVNKSGTSRKIRKGFWHLEYGESDAVDLEEKVNQLLEKLTGDLEVWQEITQKYKADVFCGLFIDKFNEGFAFSPNIMRKLADRNLEIDIDIYAPVNTWPDEETSEY
jgi:hypothetical protein